jgi:hypothetical protein
VIRHPEVPDVTGLRNLSPASWVARPPDGAPTTIPPGRSVAIRPGTGIDFGQITGIIEP